MKKTALIFFILGLLAAPAGFVRAAEIDLAKQLSGRILLQVESYGRAWYVYPKTNERYYLQDGPAAYFIMRSLGLGIADKDLAKIPTAKGEFSDIELINRVKGRILLRVEKNGEAWYVNPIDGLRYYLKDGEAAYEIMRKFSLGINNDNLRQIPMNQTQVVHDTTFNNVAYVKYDGISYSHDYYADTILPLASLTKLMTASVFLEQKPNWTKNITISREAIDYPGLYAGGDKTSEVDLAQGDQISLDGLWVAMLLASSNQAAAALVDATGLGRPEFVALMNKKAEELGLKKTKFYDIAGLDSHNVTTPKEMAIIAKAAFAQAQIAEATRLSSYSVAAVAADNSAKNIEVKNRNYSLMQYGPDGAKTGYLIEAQRTAALKKGDEIIVVMHAGSLSQRNKIIEALLGR
ncbi:MAG: hypothetical protein A2663_03995 [Candidatus Buchananbacteria bacterium RIFCSPHIGHO2_01_FULL_46_12]|uniref:Peptidase S11 D-alanyl-D-alanine carboxypeptidase A N-terminal domain-containing protein n=2 Tax=Candidatus Buchananiibacteriota TaxID=1817903 RepID=A0A1G1Y685_9BACT|nr:MAG: hypothetical protein A2663_03995 [Candidatus Buchananbacteria bacterium RIFCSPHIGHO2_01_FULL_46_12]OGY53197.1 MAG: hypothetical protein A3B15_02855 [Candidatus Buchananbacteria bacterium RIFCSPLOWO2_01_FULL_45_31]